MFGVEEDMNQTELQTLTTPAGTVQVGMEATVSYGSDSHPGKVSRIVRVRGGYEYHIMEYRYHADPTQPKGPGHQNWVIDWDQPNGEVVLKVRLNGKAMKLDTGFTHISLGHARAYYCWEF